HVVHEVRLDVNEVAPSSAYHFVGREFAAVANLGIGLGDNKSFLTVGGEIIEMTAYLAVINLSIWRLQEPEIVDAGESSERRNQTNVRACRRFDRANAAIVGRMNVADFESGAIARKTAWSKSRQPALVRQFGQRIDLVHELRKLASTEEVADDGGQRFRVDQ